MAMEHGMGDPFRIIECFKGYTDHLYPAISRARFEKNLSLKILDLDFRADITPLLRSGQNYDIDVAVMMIHDKLISRLAGKPYSGTDSIFI